MLSGEGCSMEQTEFFVVNSFTKKSFEGNPAAVVLGADGFTTDTMQKIARQFNLVETVFVTSLSAEADFDFSLRYFTPTEEVSIAIHPTIAALVALRESETLNSSGGTCIINTKKGTVV